jgi:hypothetical protein
MDRLTHDATDSRDDGAAGRMGATVMLHVNGSANRSDEEIREL